MERYALNPPQEKSVKVYGRALRISKKSSDTVCRKITGMNLEKGKLFLARLALQKENINKKYYTKTTMELLKLLSSAESNAEAKGLDIARMRIHATAHKGFTFHRPRSWKNRRTRRKVCNIQIVLEQR